MCSYYGWVGLALIHRTYGDIDLAWANIARALDENQNNSTAIQLMMDWGIKDSRFNEVIDRCKSYLLINDQDAEMSLGLARILMCAGRIGSAQIEIERALALNPQIEGGMELCNLIANNYNKSGE